MPTHGAIFWVDRNFGFRPSERYIATWSVPTAFVTKKIDQLAGVSPRSGLRGPPYQFTTDLHLGADLYSSRMSKKFTTNYLEELPSELVAYIYSFNREFDNLPIDLWKKIMLHRARMGYYTNRTTLVSESRLLTQAGYRYFWTLLGTRMCSLSNLKWSELADLRRARRALLIL